jgi:hypothetical protein
MVLNTKVNGKMIKNKVKVKFNGLMEIIMMVFGKIINSLKERDKKVMIMESNFKY